jgi:tetratricopeptide (TPR) repeat protein
MREPANPEAWFYLAGAHAPLTQWRILRGQQLTAAREARRIKDALERAVALDPTLHDAYFGIGLYHYYAAVAPPALRFLRALLLMPGGDRARGLREMLQARNHGVLLSGEADFQMHYVYLWYERDTARAIELLRGLDAHYPSNPLFLQRIAEIERGYRHDGAAATAAWATLLVRARARTVAGGAGTEALARLGLAEELLERGAPAQAVETIAPLLQDIVDVRLGTRSRAEFIAARAWAARGERERAIAALDRAIALTPTDDPHAIKSRARTMRARLRSAAP